MVKRLPSDIAYLQLTTDTHKDLRKVFRENRYNLNSCFKYPDLKTKLKEINFGSILINCGKIKEVSLDVANKLEKDFELLSYPLVFLCSNPEEIEKILGESSLLFKTLYLDTSSEDIVKALEEFNLQFDSYVKELQDKHPDIYQKLKLKFVDTSKLKKTDTEISRAEADEIAKTVVGNLNSINPANHLSASSFQNQVTLEDLKIEGFFPKNEAHQEYATELYTKLRVREKYRINRNIFINGKTCRLLAFNNKHLDQAISAGYICIGELTANSDLIRKNLYLDQSKKLRQEAATLIKRALDNQTLMAVEPIADVVDRAASILDESIKITNDDVSLLASTVIGSKIINSSCFQQGFWNMEGVHWLINSISRGKLKFLHPEALSGMLAFASRGIDCEYGFDQKLKSNKRKNIVSIPLCDMKSGMKLAGALVSKEGSTIIESDTYLDDDLILRIIKFSAIDPILTMSIYADSM